MKAMGNIITVIDIFANVKTVITNSFKEVGRFANDPFYCGRFCNPNMR